MTSVVHAMIPTADVVETGRTSSVDAELAAVDDALDRLGSDDVSLALIARASGISTWRLRRRFGDVEATLDAVVELRIGRLSSGHGTPRPMGSLNQRVTHIVRHRLDAFRAMSSTLGFLHTAGGGRARLRRFERELSDDVVLHLSAEFSGLTAAQRVERQSSIDLMLRMDSLNHLATTRRMDLSTMHRLLVGSMMRELADLAERHRTPTAPALETARVVSSADQAIVGLTPILS